MFETAEVGNKVDKQAFKKQAPKIRAALLERQKELAGSGLSVVLLVGGVEGAGKSETVNLLLEWMDARGIAVHALGPASDEERERPPMWRFWRQLPPRGRIGVFLGSWYTGPIVDRVFGDIDDTDLEKHMARIVDFERMLAAEGVVLLKFWMHLSKDAQRERLEALAADKKQRWRLTKTDWKFFKRYDKFRRVSEEALRRTSTGEAPWHIVEAVDERYRALAVTRTLLGVLEARLQQDRAARAHPPARKPDTPKPRPINVLSALDQKRKPIGEDAYDQEVLRLQGRIHMLGRRLYHERSSMLLVFEGPDAAGKGGAIRRIAQALDARTYQVSSVAAPTDEERAHPYLWRFWRNLPRLGRVTIYDRSWYGRVLVERLEGFCAPADWQRAYAEINAFEEQLTEFGIIVRKFWLAITAEEQLRRFKDREITPYKQYKITEEDWRNRAKWGAYEAAACDMIEKTSSEHAPWILVPANDKLRARVKVLKNVAKALEEGLG